MNGPLPDVRATARPNGLIDTIQAGFNAVNRNAWILLLPILIDLSLWLGPQVTVGPLFHRWLTQLTPPPGASSELVRTMEEGRQSSLDRLDKDPGFNRYNVISLLSVPIVGVPSYHAGSPGDGPELPLQSGSAAVTATIVCVVAGLMLAAAFYGLMGQAVREGRATATEFAADFPPILTWTVALFFLVLTIGLAIGAPLGLVLLLTRTAAPAIGSILVPILVGMLLWAVVYLFFWSDAIFVSRVPPLIAARQSIRVVRNNFWSTLGLIGLILIISAGLPILWNEIAINLHGPGIALAMLGHIYVSSGLAAASMTYYKERFERLT